MILLRPKPGCQLEVVALVQGVKAEVGLDHLRCDADCSAELLVTNNMLVFRSRDQCAPIRGQYYLQTVDNLCSDVLQRDARGHCYHSHCGVSLTNERRLSRQLTNER